MTGNINKDNLFSAPPTKSQSKAEITDSTARAIIKAEADRREAKTLRLKQARLEMEARQPEPAPAKRRTGKTTKSAASRRAA